MKIENYFVTAENFARLTRKLELPSLEKAIKVEIVSGLVP